VSRLWIGAVVLGCAAGLVGCGSEPPYPGELEVTSLPAGAAIAIDGVATGQVTPAVFADLDGGTYAVSVSQTGVEYRPPLQEIEVPFGGRACLHFGTEAGILTVTSDPAGAEIVLDGEATGVLTPHTFAALDPGQYSVSLALAHHRSEPSERTVDVVCNAETTADFQLVLMSVVLFESFSNVRCSGCPALVNAIEYLMHDGGFGFDRLVHVKYAGAVPYPLDPLYRSNMAMVNERSVFYSGQTSFALPTLFAQGQLQGTYGSPPNTEALAAIIEAGNLAPVGFYLTVAAPNVGTLAERDVPCEITVQAPYASVDLSAYGLRAVLVYSEVTPAVEYDPGGDEYHWVARRDAAVTTSVGEVAPGAPATFTVTLNDPDPAAYNLTPLGREVIVFVQHPSTKSIIQAGSTMITDDAGRLATRLEHSGGL